MDNKESTIPDPITPSKNDTETPILRTPRGGALYNPFQKDYVARLEAPTLTPGIFATPKKLSFDEGSHPSEFVWSPEVQGDYFPTEIDENPTYQVKMQQKLDADVDESAQKSISKYFSSNLVAPSPDFVSYRHGKLEMRKSSTRKTDLQTAFEFKKPKLLEPSQVIDAQTQTRISVSTIVDFDAILKKCEESEKFKHTSEEGVLSQLGIGFGEATAIQYGQPYPLYPNAACSFCHRKSLSFSNSCNLHGDSSRTDTIKNVMDSSGDTLAIQSDVSSIQEEFALPFSFMSESVCSPPRPRKARSSAVCTNLTGVFGEIAIDQQTPTRNFEESGSFVSTSPLMGGQTSYDLEDGFRPSAESFPMEDGLDPQFTDANFVEESTQDTPNKENCDVSKLRKRGMVSPNLSPIFLRRRKYNDEEVFMERRNRTGISENDYTS